MAERSEWRDSKVRMTVKGKGWRQTEGSEWRGGDGRTAIWQYHLVVLAVCCVNGKVKGRYSADIRIDAGNWDKNDRIKRQFYAFCGSPA